MRLRCLDTRGAGWLHRSTICTGLDRSPVEVNLADKLGGARARCLSTRSFIVKLCTLALARVAKYGSP